MQHDVAGTAAHETTLAEAGRDEKPQVDMRSGGPQSKEINTARFSLFSMSLNILCSVSFLGSMVVEAVSRGSLRRGFTSGHLCAVFVLIGMSLPLVQANHDLAVDLLDSKAPIRTTRRAQDANQYITPVNPGDVAQCPTDYAFAGPAFFDISTTGTKITDWAQNADDGWFEITLSFTMLWYGNNENAIHVGTNGYITFGTAHFGGAESEPFPGTPTGPVDGVIGVYWADINPDPWANAADAGVFYQAFGADSMVVQWHNVVYYSSNATVTFQATLFPTGGVIFAYGAMHDPPGESWLQSIGYESQDGLSGVQISYNVVPGSNTAYYIPPVCTSRIPPEYPGNCLDYPVFSEFPAYWDVRAPATITERDIRSGDPQDESSVRLPDVFTDQPPNRLRFSYEYLVNYTGGRGPSFTVGLVDVTTEMETLVYESPELNSTYQWDTCDDFGLDNVTGDGCYSPPVFVDEPVIGFNSTGFYVQFRFTNNDGNLYLNDDGLNMVISYCTGDYIQICEMVQAGTGKGCLGDPSYEAQTIATGTWTTEGGGQYRLAEQSLATSMANCLASANCSFIWLAAFDYVEGGWGSRALPECVQYDVAGHNVFQKVCTSGCPPGQISAPGVCSAINRNDYSSWDAMHASGWDSVGGILNVNMDVPEVITRCFGGTNFFGWAHGQEVGELSFTVPATGTATVDFGNCWPDSGEVVLYRNGERVASANPNEQSVVHVVSIHEGDILALRDEGTNSVIRLNSVVLDCPGTGIGCLAAPEEAAPDAPLLLPLPVCTQPASTAGYVVTETQLDIDQGFQVTVSCDSGYAGANPLAGACEVAYSYCYTNLAPTDFSVGGSCVVEGDMLRITQPTANQIGTAFVAVPVTAADSVSIMFDMYCGDGTGADGMCANLGYNSMTGREAEDGLAVGVSLCFDEWADSGDHGVMMVYNGAAFWEDILSSPNRSGGPPVSYFEDATWHRVVWDIVPSGSGASVSFSLDGDTYGVENQQIPIYSLPAVTYLGFSGRTSGATNNHWAKNVAYRADQDVVCNLTAGSYSLSGCEGCVSGQYAEYAAAGATSCSECSAGQIAADALAAGCTACMPGTQALGVGNSECTGCAAGSADLDNDPSTPCEPCPAGFESNRGRTVCRAIVSENGTDCADNVASDWREYCTYCLDENDTNCLAAAFEAPDDACWTLPYTAIAACVEQCIEYFDAMFCEVAATGSMVLDMDYGTVQDDPTFVSECEAWIRELVNVSSAAVRIDAVIPGSVDVEFSVLSSSVLSDITNTTGLGVSSLDTLQTALAGGNTFRDAAVVDFVADICGPGFRSNSGGFFVACDSEAETCAAGCVATPTVPAIMCELVAPITASDCLAGCSFTAEIAAEPPVATCTETAAAETAAISEACDADPAVFPQPDCTTFFVAGDQGSCDAIPGCTYTAAVGGVQAGVNTIQADADACASVDVTAVDGDAACAAVMTVANESVSACTYRAAGSLTSAVAATCGDNVPEVPATCTGTSTVVDPGARACVPCAAGYFGDGSASFCAPCAVGRFSYDAATTCTGCAPGQYAPVEGSASYCISCHAGQYQEVAASSFCASCPQGTVLSAFGSSDGQDCEACPLGKSSIDPSNSCVDCMVGRYADELGATDCKQCDFGKALTRSGGSSQADCIDCAAGQFSYHPALSCELCAPGKYAESGQFQCADCAMGRFRTTAGGDSEEACEECSPGQYGTDPAVSCEYCEAGRFIAAAGQTYCENCPLGTASSETGNSLESHCASCAPGRHMPSLGATECLACSAGSIATGSGNTECADCEPGRYVAANASATCLPCPLGRYTPSLGATECEWCAQGEDTPGTGTLHADNCTACVAGRFLEANTDVPLVHRQGKCADCAPGSHTNREDRQVACAPCGFGTYSSSGSPNCTECPVGRFTNEDPSYLRDRCQLCPDGTGTVLQTGLHGNSSLSVCHDCPAGFYFYAADPDYRYQDPVTGEADVWLPPDLDDPTLDYLSCRRCAPGKHTYGAVTGEPCTRCPADPKGKASNFICEGGGCKVGHADTEGGFCGSCVSLDVDEAEGNCGENRHPCGGDGEEPCGSLGPYRETCGYFAKGFDCVECSDPVLVASLGFGGLVVCTSILTWTIVKGFSADDVGRVQGGMDFTKAMTATFGMFQRLTAVLTLPFGWPAWLVELCYYLKGIVAFDLPGLAAPECNAAQSAAEMQLTRLTISALALPVVWGLIFIEMAVIRNCSKMGKRKAARGTSLFGCTLFGFGRLGCPEGAFQSVVVTMHGLFFLNVIQSAFAALDCRPFSDGAGGRRMALAVNPAVYCEREVGKNWGEDDVIAYIAINSMATFMVIFYGFLMSFLHWHVKVEYVGIWNKAFVSAIVIFFNEEEDALTALMFLCAVSAFFAVLGNRWKRMLDQDGDDSNDAEEDAFFCMEVGCYCELMTYAFGITLVQGYEIEPGQVGINVSWYSWGNVSAYTILAVMTLYAIWTFKLGIQDEIAARRAEKAAVAHILFREMDADGSGKLDFGEVQALCERLGQKKTDEEITKALRQMDKDGSMQADADEFVNWWIFYGGRKVPIPDEYMNLADMAGGRAPPRGNPFHSAEDFQIDDEVRWFKTDEDVPRGTIGHVVGFKPKAGGSWKSGDLGLGPKVVVNNRVYVAWPNKCCFAHEPGELLLYSGKRTVPVGASWRGVFPMAAEELEGDDGGEHSATTDGEMEEVDVPLDFIVGDHVVVKERCTVSGVPKNGDIGAVTGFTDKLVCKVLFSSCKDEFQISPMDLKLEVANADNTVAEAWAHVAVEAAQVATEQTEADQDHEELLQALMEMKEKALKKRLAKLYPSSNATRIDKTKGNGVDDRLPNEKKKEWRRRIMYEHSVEIADQEKRELDELLAQKAADVAERKEKLRIDYEHFTHKSVLGIHEARIAHAEKMHAEIVQQHDKDLKNVRRRRHWTVRASKARKKTAHVMRDEATARGIDTEGLKKKKHVKKALVEHQKTTGEARKQEQLDRIEAERERHAKSRLDHDGFVEKHGLGGAEPGFASGLGKDTATESTTFENPLNDET